MIWGSVKTFGVIFGGRVTPENLPKFWTLHQTIPTSLAKQKANTLYQNCTRIAKATSGKELRCAVLVSTLLSAAVVLRYLLNFRDGTRIHPPEAPRPRSGGFAFRHVAKFWLKLFGQ